MPNRSGARGLLPYNGPPQPYPSPMPFQSRGRDSNSRTDHKSKTVPAPWAQSNSEAVAKFGNMEVWEQRPPSLDLPNQIQLSSFSSGLASDLAANSNHLEHTSDPHPKRQTSECGKIKCNLKNSTHH